jgi:predicted dehydrogenase
MGKEINIALIGYKFMGKAHSNAYLSVSKFFSTKLNPVLKIVCGRDEKAVRAFQEQWGWEEFSTDWRKVVAREDVDVIDISTPNNSHCAIALAAAHARKHIICEKPLAMNVAEAMKMTKAVKKARVVNMICHNYRRVPALSLAKEMIEADELGKIYHYRSFYLQDWITDPNFPLVWRLRKEQAGSGVHGDLNAHIIDLAHYLVGDISEVVGMMETFIKQRPIPSGMSGLSARGSRKMGKVTVDDAVLALARFKNGALGSFEATRFALGRKNGQRIEINGSKGSIVFELERLNELQYYRGGDQTGRRGFRLIQVTEPQHPFIQGYWPPGHIIGYEHSFINTVKDFLDAIATGKRNVKPDFEDGLKVQKVLEAVEKSCRAKKWVKI